MFKHILLGVDGSTHALKAAQYAGELARTMQSDLCIVVAYDPIPPYLGEPNLENTIAARIQHARDILESAIRAVGQIPGKMSDELLVGAAAEVLLQVAHTYGSDLIVIGSRGHGMLAGLLLGSHSQKVIQHAPCPVLVVR